jgi:hypothetical protein
MKRKLKPVIFLLALALLIQNTCPFGAAGKSVVTASCRNCPLQHSVIISLDGQKNLVPASASGHFPLYVFAVPKTLHLLQLEPIKSATVLLAQSYEDTLPDEILRPPQA